MKVFDIKFIRYNHPFISFEVKVSEGSYIRSLAQIFLKNIGCVARDLHQSAAQAAPGIREVISEQ